MKIIHFSGKGVWFSGRLDYSNNAQQVFIFHKEIHISFEGIV